MKLTYCLLAIAMTAFFAGVASAETCYSSVKDAPATCAGGTITQDSVSGSCRTIECTSGSSSMKALGCDKPDTGTPQHFEMYKQSQIGAAVSEVCLGETCISTSGYAKSDEYPLCAASAESGITVLEEFSAHHNIVMRCQTPIENASTYTWHVEGEQVYQKNISDYGPYTDTFPNYFHTFPGTGNYAVSCTAEKDGQSETVSADIQVSTPASPEEIEFGRVVVRPHVDYRGDYNAFVSCEVYGAPTPAAWFWVQGSHGADNELNQSGNIEFRLGGSKIAENEFALNLTVSDYGDYSALCRGGTAHENERADYHNRGMPIGFGCFGSARGGEPVCNTQQRSTHFTVPKEEDIFSGIKVERTGDNLYAFTCLIPGQRGQQLDITAPNLTSAEQYAREGTTIDFSTSEDVLGLACRLYGGWTTSGHQINGGFSRTVDLTTVPGASDDPGALSSLRITKAVINGQQLPMERSMPYTDVAPGTRMQGEVTLQYDSAWPEDVSVPFGLTYTWGDHKSSFIPLGYVSGSGERVVEVDFTMPRTEGHYPVVFAFRAEVDHADVFSMTNWAANPEVWDDGNDIASWSGHEITIGAQNGKLFKPALFDSGMRDVYVPMSSIHIDTVGEPVDDGSNPGSGEVCYSRVSELPVECSGQIVSDTSSGACRTIECRSGSGYLKALACDKDSHFELYRQSAEGTAPNLCLAGACLENFGYKRGSDYPICTDEPEEPACVPSSEVCDGVDNDCDGAVDEGGICGSTGDSVELSIKPWYPQGRDYVFVCDASYAASQYYWEFGDGSSQITSADNVYHKYQNAGGYAVSCEARSSHATVTDTLQITVS